MAALTHGEWCDTQDCDPLEDNPCGQCQAAWEAAVENCHSTQQLKAEIAVGLSKLELYISTGRGEYLEDCVKYLRQLSAV